MSKAMEYKKRCPGCRRDNTNVSLSQLKMSGEITAKAQTQEQREGAKEKER